MLNSQELEAFNQSAKEQSDKDGINVWAVGAAVVWANCLLIVRRSEQEDVFPNNWEIPGGSVDQGETLEIAVARELKEETGLETVGIEKFLGTMDFQLSDGRIVRQYNFLIKTMNNQVTLNPVEHSALEWLPIDNPKRLDELQVSDLMRATIKELLPKLK